MLLSKQEPGSSSTPTQRLSKTQEHAAIEDKSQKKSLMYENNLLRVLGDKSTQVDSSQISLVQVDLEKIKYIIQFTFLHQKEIQFNR